MKYHRLSHDLHERAVWTAAQAGLAVVVASGAGWVDVAVWKAAGIAAGAAGISAMKTLMKEYQGGEM